VAAGNHNVVTTVCRRVVDRLVLAHQDESNTGRQAAERTRVGAGINIVPCPGVGKTGLSTNIRNSSMQLGGLVLSKSILRQYVPCQRFATCCLDVMKGGTGSRASTRVSQRIPELCASRLRCCPRT
jgi:hypothetical protein